MSGLAGISSSQINRDVLKSETVKFKQNFQWGGPKDLFGICMSEFHVELIAYWSAATGEVTDLKKATAMEE
ncbi:Ribosome assembly factor mrt4 like protein [Verticillium longisporum]|nr:Ribosome assembly factor mrt4 like protein [Verticillium longisporum]